MHENNITTTPGAADDNGCIPTSQATTNNGTSRSNIETARIAEVEPSAPGELDRPLYLKGTEDPLEPDAQAKFAIVCWKDANGVYLVKSPIGVGYVSEAEFDALVGEVEAALPHETEPIQTAPPGLDARIEHAADNHNPGAVESGGGHILPPTPVAPASAPDPEPKPEAVIKLAPPASPEGPFFRESDGSPVDLKTTTASYVCYIDSTNVAVVLKNTFGSRRAPYRVRPTLASNESAMARRLHGKAADEVKARVRATVTRSGPATPVEAWTEMLAAFTIFPGLLDELNLTDETLDGLIKLLHNSGFMKGQKADNHGVYFQVADGGTVEIEVRGEGKLTWIACGPRDPAELMRLALLVGFLNYKATRRRGLRK